MNPADEDSYVLSNAEITHDVSESYFAEPDEELDSDNSPLASMLNHIHHLPAPSGDLIARIRFKGKEEYAVREVESGGVFAYNCDDTRMVIPICASINNLPADERERDERLRTIIRMQRKHYEA